MNPEYDVIVVGGGPAGAVAAKVAAAGGLKVLLLEKDEKIGEPVRCAEGVSKDSIIDYIQPDERWICTEIRHIRFYSPNGTVVNLYNEGVGYVLDRKIFDAELAAQAQSAGAEVLVSHCVTGLIIQDNKVAGVKVKSKNNHYSITSNIVIGADGVESRVGRWAGIPTHISLQDIEPCIQFVVTNIDIEPHTSEFYFGQSIAPGGYLWVFPKGKDTANIGVGISGKYGTNFSLVDVLTKFINRRYAHPEIVSTVAGGVPLTTTLKQIVTDGLMLVGDAARQTNPLSGAGIATAIKSGKLAGEVALKSAQKNDYTTKTLIEYQKLWNKSYGRLHRRYYRIKLAVSRISDQSLDRAANVLSRVDSNKLRLRKVFATVLKHDPRLLLDIRYLFGRTRK